MLDASLTDFVQAACTESHLRVETDLGDGFVRLKSEEAERRQAAHDIRSSEDALIELLRNSRDAHAHAIFVATAKTEGTRKLLVIDDGDGIPEAMQDLIFQPRVTSKLDTMHFDKWGVHGRGMALFAVRSNACKSGVALSRTAKGTALFADFDTEKVSEKSDQSTFPSFALSENNKVSVRGPKNLIRTACEFAFEHRDQVSVYFGSPAEVASTLYAYGKATLSLIDQAFGNSLEAVPITKRLALASDEESFCKIAAALGLELSERTAYRIMGGKGKILPELLECIQDALFSSVESQVSPSSEASSLGHAASSDESRFAPIKKGKKKPISFSNDDLCAFTSVVSQGYKELADSYYLDPEVAISAHIQAGNLVLRIPLISDDLS